VPVLACSGRPHGGAQRRTAVVLLAATCTTSTGVPLGVPPFRVCATRATGTVTHRARTPARSSGTNMPVGTRIGASAI
jgi:hypothetical protein